MGKFKVEISTTGGELISRPSYSRQDARSRSDLYIYIKKIFERVLARL
nr:MAG TPA: hypothetical protein [Caudoviricetes sp.]